MSFKTSYDVAGTGWLRPGDPGGPTWGTGWADNNSTTAERGQMKKVGATVKVRGLVFRTSGAGLTIMTLPVGCRPNRTTYRPALMSNQWAYITIDTAGVVAWSAGGAVITNSVTAIGFDIAFDTDQS